jgi:hypothetical protein
MAKLLLDARGETNHCLKDRAGKGEAAAWPWQRLPVLVCCVAITTTASNEVNADHHGHTTGRWSDVTSWMVEAESQLLPVDGDDLSAKRAENPRIVHRIVAASSNNELYFFCGHVDHQMGSDWRNEPFNMQIWLQNEKLTKYRTFNRQVIHFARFPAGSEIPNLIASDVLFLFLPPWPLTNYPSPHNKSMIFMIFSINAALSSGTYKPTLQRQLIGDQLCWEIRSPDGNDRIWLADDKDLCLMRREWLNPKTGAKLGEIRTRRVAEVGSGLWMPVEIEDIQYSSSAAVETNSPPTSRVITRVLSWRLGSDVPMGVFQPSLKPGSIELIEPGKFRQLSSGGTEYLDEVAAFYRGPIGLPQRPPLAMRLIYSIVLVAAGGLVGVVLFHLRLKRHTGTSIRGGNRCQTIETENP